jgi:hypothetical protein
MNLCHSCNKYKNDSHFNIYMNIPNRRCKKCLMHAQMEKYENPKDQKPYIILLQMNIRDSDEYSYLLPFFREMYEDVSLENLEIAPYIQLTGEFWVQDIESILDKLYQFGEAEPKFMDKPESYSQYSEDGYLIVSVSFNSNKLRKFLKQLSLNFPFIVPYYKQEMVLFKTKNSNRFSQFEIPSNWKVKWNIVIRKTDGNGKILSEGF